jgi:hypothetical protein
MIESWVEEPVAAIVPDPPSRYHLPAKTGFRRPQAALPSVAPPCDVLVIRLSRRSSRTQHGIYDAAPPPRGRDLRLAFDTLLVIRTFAKSTYKIAIVEFRRWLWGLSCPLTKKGSADINKKTSPGDS